MTLRRRGLFDKMLQEAAAGNTRGGGGDFRPSDTTNQSSAGLLVRDQCIGNLTRENRLILHQRLMTFLCQTGPLTDEFSGSCLKMLSWFPPQLHWNDVTL